MQKVSVLPQDGPQIPTRIYFSLPVKLFKSVLEVLFKFDHDTGFSHSYIKHSGERGKKAYYDLVFAKINCLAVRSWPLPSANGEEVLPHNLMHCPKSQCHRKLRLQSRFSLNLIFALSIVQPSGMLGLHQPVLLLFRHVYDRSYDIISAASLAKKQEKDWWPK